MLEMSGYAVRSIKLKNIHIDRVLEAVETFMQHGKPVCNCQECALDILAMTLNRIPARYVVNETLMDLHGSRDSKLSEEMLQEHLKEAATRVGRSPRCEPSQLC